MTNEEILDRIIEMVKCTQTPSNCWECSVALACTHIDKAIEYLEKEVVVENEQKDGKGISKHVRPGTGDRP